MDMMADDSWTHRSVGDLATRYGVRRQVIERDAAEAVRTLNRLHAGTMEQRQEARARLLVRLRGWRAKALTARDGRPDMGAIARLEDIEAKIVGAYAPVETRELGEFANAPTVQLIAELLRADPSLGEPLKQLLLSPPKPEREVIDVVSQSVAGRAEGSAEDPGHAGAGAADGEHGDEERRGDGAGPAWQDDGG